jgi:hypothetical protein
MKKLTCLPGLSAVRNVKLLSNSTAVFALLFFTLIVSSCRKKEETPQPQPDTEQATAADNNLAEGTAADIDAMGSQASESSELSTFKTTGNVSATNVLTVAPCATITVAPAARIFTIDFGTSCVGRDGRTRSGKLIYDCSASASNALYYRNPGFVMNVTSQNYVVQGNQVNIISKKVTNTTPSNIPSTPAPGINLTWSVVSSISITKAGGGNITWSCNRTKELTNTNDTTCYRGQSLHIIWTKAIVKLNGSASGTNAKNETYTAVASNVVRDFNCSPDAVHPHRHPFISGSVTYTPGSRPVRVIDYGNGACDLLATVAINNQTYTITLP